MKRNRGQSKYRGLYDRIKTLIKDRICVQCGQVYQRMFPGTYPRFCSTGCRNGGRGTCEGCGNDYQRNFKKQRYCKFSCKNLKPSKGDCAVCGKALTHEQTKFCGLVCTAIGRDDYTRVCQRCNHEYKSRSNAGKHCVKCRDYLKWDGRFSYLVSCVCCRSLVVGSCQRKKCIRWRSDQTRWLEVRTRVRKCQSCEVSFTWHDNQSNTTCRTCAKRKAKEKWKRYNRQRRSKKRLTYDGVSDREIFERDKWRCEYCKKKIRPCDGKDFAAKRMATIDHVIPLSKGGTDESTNKVSACFECNCHKKGAAQWTLF